MTSTKNTVDKFLNFLSNKDLEKLSQLFAENVDWNVPGNENLGLWLGQRNGRKEVKEFYELLWQNVAPISANIDTIFIKDEQAILSGEFSVKMLTTGKLVDSIFYIQLTITDGLIVKYRLLEDSYAVSEGLSSN